MSENRHSHWRVSVETSSELIVAIEPEMLAGRETSEADEDAIRTAAHHLLAFIGDPAPQPNVRRLAEAVRKQLVVMTAGSCDCGTKSPQALWHLATCRFRQGQEAMENVEDIIAALNPAPQPNLMGRILAYLEGCDPKATSGGERNSDLRDAVRKVLEASK